MACYRCLSAKLNAIIILGNRKRELEKLCSVMGRKLLMKTQLNIKRRGNVKSFVNEK